MLQNEYWRSLVQAKRSGVGSRDTIYLGASNFITVQNLNSEQMRALPTEAE